MQDMTSKGLQKVLQYTCVEENSLPFLLQFLLLVAPEGQCVGRALTSLTRTPSSPCWPVAKGDDERLVILRSPPCLGEQC